MTKGPGEEYTPLLSLLEGYWDRSFSRLPKQIRAVVEKKYVPVTWGMTNAQGRENLAVQIDYQNDPACAEDREHWFNYYTEMDDLRDRIEEWEQLEAPTPSERRLKDDGIEALKAKLVEMEANDPLKLCPEAIQADETHAREIPKVGSKLWRQQLGKKAANAKYDKPGGYREKHEKLRASWASGRYKSRDACANAECASLGISYSSARKALINTPDPT